MGYGDGVAGCPLVGGKTHVEVVGVVDEDNGFILYWRTEWTDSPWKMDTNIQLW